MWTKFHPHPKNVRHRRYILCSYWYGGTFFFNFKASGCWFVLALFKEKQKNTSTLKTPHDSVTWFELEILLSAVPSCSRWLKEGRLSHALKFSQTWGVLDPRGAKGWKETTRWKAQFQAAISQAPAGHARTSFPSTGEKRGKIMGGYREFEKDRYGEKGKGRKTVVYVIWLYY